MDKQTFVVVGVSQDSKKYGHRIFRDMVYAGWKVYGVNPKGGKVEGHKLYPSIAELPVIPDTAVLVIPPQAAKELLPEIVQKGIRHVWFQPGAESEDGITEAERLGLHVTHSACIMIRSGLW
ncbi:MAG: CoA-binding protein [Patescibacteria group bacterium]|nr:CoA-binding protein [Patescibacteria group bacterium]